jgi:serine/threonine protein kinase
VKKAPITKLPHPYGKYELLQRLGKGGMAEVFRASLPGAAGFVKTVVIKRILPQLTHLAEIEQSFVAEANLAVGVQHKNVVQVFELGQLDDGEYFMSMEYVDGMDLAKLLRRAARKQVRIPPWFSVWLIAEVLDGLSYVHDLADEQGRPRGIIHRDVTPSNVFISNQGDVKLGDFGVARELSQESKTIPGQLKGKLAYMSPEQIYHHQIDRRTDIFAAGVVLWECLTQQRLFGGGGRPEVTVMNLIVHGERTPPSHIKPDVPVALDACVLRALQSDPEARYQNARGFRAQLLDVLLEMKQNVQPEDVRQLVNVLAKGPQLPTAPEVPTLVARPAEISGPGVDPSGPGSPSARGKSAPIAAHRGTSPFWLRDGQKESGPLEYFDAMVKIKKSAPSLPITAISADQVAWMPLSTFSTLSGQESLVRSTRSEAGGRSAPWGSREQSVVGAIFDVGQRRLTGRLMASTGPIDQLRTELHIKDGRPCYVYSESLRLQLPQFLIDESVVDAARMPAMMHTVLQTGKTLISVVQANCASDRGDLWAACMQRRLLEFTQAEALHGFDASLPVEIDPFDGLLPKLLPQLVHQALSLRDLRSRLGDRLTAPTERTDRFSVELASLSLDKVELVAAMQLASGTPIAQWIEDTSELETLYLYLGYVLLETGLLRCA